MWLENAKNVSLVVYFIDDISLVVSLRVLMELLDLKVTMEILEKLYVIIFLFVFILFIMFAFS